MKLNGEGKAGIVWEELIGNGRFARSLTPCGIFSCVRDIQAASKLEAGAMTVRKKSSEKHDQLSIDFDSPAQSQAPPKSSSVISLCGRLIEKQRKRSEYALKRLADMARQLP